MIKYSFIIPIAKVDADFKSVLKKYSSIIGKDFEIIVYPDQGDSFKIKDVKIIPTGNIGPALKRNLSIKDSLGEILIFIDDDAYPDPNLLNVLDSCFKSNNIGAVGGPGVTPEENNFWQKLSGAAYYSHFSGGFPERYLSIGKRKCIEDWPTVNLAVRKNIFCQIGGFNKNCWPGEDTKLCLDIISKTDKKIIYEPKAIAYHNRRTNLISHLKQVSRYGFQRGSFALKYPKTSFKLKYFMPTILLLFITLGAWIVFAFSLKLITITYLIGILIYLLAISKASFDIYSHKKNALIALASPLYIIPTHLVYGFKFLQAIMTSKRDKNYLLNSSAEKLRPSS